jgi:hypothetical protein
VVTKFEAEGSPVVGPRAPCPCGSGRRYKACHGRQAARAETKLIARPFEGLAAECDLVAMATLVPSATARLKLAPGAIEGRESILAATLLPMAWPALHRSDGELLIGMQITGGSGDPSRDIAAALLAAVDLAPGMPVLEVGRPGLGLRLQDLLDVQSEFELSVHDGFGFWLDGSAQEPTDEVRASLERADGSVVPTTRLVAVDAAYWCRIGSKEHLRWALPEDEERLLDAFARMQASEQLNMGPGTRYIGSFRSHGLLIAVWDLAPGDEAADIETPAIEFRSRLDAALTVTEPLSAEQRRIRGGLAGRQLTLR